MAHRRAGVSCAWLCALACWAFACGDDSVLMLSREPDDDDNDAGAQRVCTRCGECEQYFAVTSIRHLVGPIDYPDKPPAGGDHNECWAAFGVHDAPAESERWVHTLEHGGVAFLYDCPEGCTDEVSKLAALAQDKRWALVTSYADMPTRFAVVAWKHRLTSDCLDLSAFEAFYDAHANHGPESIPSGPPPGCPP